VRISEANKDILISPSSASPDPPKSVTWAVFRPPPLLWRGLAVVEGVAFGMLVLAEGSSPGRWGIVGISDVVDPDLVRLTERLEASFKRASSRLADIVYLSSSGRFRFRR